MSIMAFPTALVVAIGLATSPSWLPVAAAAAGAFVGLSLGLTGGGGAIFAVPLLVYGLGVEPATAVAISLVTVAATAASTSGWP